MHDNINVNERLHALIQRRGYEDMSEFDTKYRGKLKTTKYMVYEASQKRHLFSSFLKGL